MPVPIELASSSATGELATSAAGPWSPTLATTIPSGAATASFYFRDSNSGSISVTATAAGKTAATQPVTVAAGLRRT